MQKRFAMLVAAMMLAMSLLTACGAPAEPTAPTADGSTPTAASAPKDGKPVTVEFYYPVQVGGKVSELIEQYAVDFQKENPDIIIKPIFSGSYTDTMQKLIPSIQAGNQPQFTILSNVSLLTLMSMDALEPLNDLIAADGGNEYINDFYPGFMANSVYEDQVYSIPFQRSALLMFYNKEHFREVGLDPEVPPRTWEEMADAAAKLSKFDANGNAERWGLLIPSSGAWNFQPFCISNSADGSNMMSADGTEVYFDTPENVEALAYLKNLSTIKASPEGVIKMETAPASFIAGKASMVHISSGNLANIDSSVDFEYGIAKLPKAKQDASIAGGGNIYILKGSTPEQLQATWRFVRYLTEPDRQAQWNVDTGYIAARKSAFDSEIMRKYYEDVPQAKTAHEQLESCFNELKTYESEKVGASLTAAYDSVMTGQKTPEQALKDAQAECDAALAPYKKK